ncbi:MAG: type IV pilus biogenesis protein PilM [Syntrophaceae bacterium]
MRLAVLAGKGNDTAVVSQATALLPSGILNDSYGTLNITDPGGFSSVLKDLIKRMAPRKAVRTAVSLPDSLFRLQTFEFDDLPAGASDRERLIRWRFEKLAAFDTSDTLLHYQVLPLEGKSVLLLSCFAKREVVKQYEDLLTGLGLEPWHIWPSSLSLLNFYFPAMSRRSSTYAMAAVSRAAFASLVVEQGGVRFYRYKEVRAGRPEDVRDRLVRELDDSLHFYMHAGRSQEQAIDRLYLSGDREAVEMILPSLTNSISLPVEVLTPSAVLPSLGNGDRSANMAAALGAGGMV